MVIYYDYIGSNPSDCLVVIGDASIPPFIRAPVAVSLSPNSVPGPAVFLKLSERLLDNLFKAGVCFEPVDAVAVNSLTTYLK